MMAPLLRNHLHISRPPKPKYDTREVGLYILRTCIYFCMTQFSKIVKKCNGNSANLHYLYRNVITIIVHVYNFMTTS